MKKHYVYVLIDPRNNQPFYVGKGVGKRMYQHVKPLEWRYNNIKAGKIRHILEAGLDIIYDVTVCETEQEAFDLEKLLIKQYGKICDGTGILANLVDGGRGGSSGRPITEEVRAKLKLRKRGTLTEAGRASMSLKNSGPKSEEHKKALQNNCPRATAVHQVDRQTGEIVNTFISAREASKQTGIDNVMISRCCKGVYPSAGGFLWRYA